MAADDGILRAATVGGDLRPRSRQHVDEQGRAEVSSVCATRVLD
jgi:hypothetical protein